MSLDLALRLRDVLADREPTVVTEWAARPAAVSAYSPDTALSNTVYQLAPSALTCVLVLW